MLLLFSGEVNEVCLAESDAAELASVLLLLACDGGIVDTMMLSGRGSMADIGIVTFLNYSFRWKKNFV